VGRLEEAADYGSGKASRFYRSPRDAYIPELEKTNLAVPGVVGHEVGDSVLYHSRLGLASGERFLGDLSEIGRFALS
jgi:hypothetical protein